MTSSPSDTETAEGVEPTHPLQGFADSVADAVRGDAEILADTVKVRLAPDDWISAHLTARDRFDLVFFSWLSAIDWANEAAAGEAPNEEVEERIELLTTVGDLSEGKRVTFSTDLPPDGGSIESLVSVYAGANWHEREAAEMFGLTFNGHPDPVNIYLPDSFIGNPLRKSYPLLSREVKPWPGTVDVEGMPEGPATENPEV